MNNDVFFVRCDDYGNALAEAFNRLSGLTGLITPKEVSGKRVLVKPNLLTDRTPEQAVTTHPELLRQLLVKLKACGAEVTVGDSPASTANLKQVWEKTGIASICAAERIPLISLEQCGATPFEIDGFAFTVANPVLNADLVVNLPKVKSHSLTVLTASVKNMYGTIPGYSKTALHRMYPKPRVFGQLIRALWQVLPRTVTIADGVVGMEGQGPANGRPIKLGFLAAAQNPFALDRALCDVLRIDFRRVPYLASSPEGELQETPTVIGDTICAPPFEIPAGAHLLNLLPDWLVRSSERLVWVRPAFSRQACTACGKCSHACPVNALSMDKATGWPVLNHKLCISCSCCHEICPSNAIRMTQSTLLRLLKVFKGVD
ncbi:MAG: DUF362 domain-containing protein [Kiritimatiellae bacterium]|nr:DUF362 domain-containing protein [Kiritimatiellia bacterium]